MSEKNQSETHEREEQDYRKITPTDTNTGLGHGVSSMGGVPVGGGAMSGENDGTTGTTSPLGTRDTDTGMVFGIGQGTSTGTLPGQGGPDLSGVPSLDPPPAGDEPP